MQFLQQALDDPTRRRAGAARSAPASCPPRGPAAADGRAARRYFRGQDVVVEPRKLWAGGLPDARRARSASWRGPGDGVRRRSRPGPGAGRAVAAGRRGAARGAGGRGRGAEALVEDLAAAGRGGRHAVASLSVAGRLGGGARRRIGRSAAGRSARGVRPAAEPRTPRRAVRAQRPAGPDVARSRAWGCSGPVLLVDDSIRTRWTVTVAGRCWPMPGLRRCCRWRSTSCPDRFASATRWSILSRVASRVRR